MSDGLWVFLGLVLVALAIWRHGVRSERSATLETTFRPPRGME